MYTRKGDQGETSLFGPRRVSKDSPRVEAYGTVDELSSAIGLAVADCSGGRLRGELKKVQSLLFVAGADLANPSSSPRGPRISHDDTLAIEKMTDDLLERLPRLDRFVLPGGTRLAAELHLARAICRRAERRVVAAGRHEAMNAELVPFFNRLSSYLFNAARYANRSKGAEEETWSSPG